jgi:ribosomal protein S18 acetylase RimI-like enzyme
LYLNVIKLFILTEIISIVHQGDSLLTTVKELFMAYQLELGEDLCFQNFSDELENPLKKYGPPKGVLLLAMNNKEIAGCVALQPLPETGTCEMKRLYVKPGFRKQQIGFVLVERLLQEAENSGYTRMKLDTLERLQPAIRLYEKFGFVNTSSYYTNPLTHVVYMEKEL